MSISVYTTIGVAAALAAAGIAGQHPQPLRASTAPRAVERVQGQPRNLDFENNLEGWSASGTAFDGQPVAGADITSDRDRHAQRIGGDYWRGLPYPLGHQGAHLVSTGDSGRGELVSDEFIIEQNDRHLSFLIGGLQRPEACSARVPGPGYHGC